MSQFNEANAHWDPQAWAALFARIGANYVVLTSKHCESFPLWPTATPNPFKKDYRARRDIVGELTSAVRAHGMRMGLYYCGGFDWTFNTAPITSAADLGLSIPQSPEYIDYCTNHWHELIERYQPSVMWGDVGYRKDLFFKPDYWRKWYKPGLAAMVDACHAAGLPVIYHGCGNVNRIFEDFIEIGIDAYNPLEAKAGMDVVELRRKYGHRIAFCGNMDVLQWAECNREELKAIVLRKLNAARGGGMIFQSDHSVPGNVSPENYEYVVNLVREYGQYPLQLGESTIPDLD